MRSVAGLGLLLVFSACGGAAFTAAATSSQDAGSDDAACSGCASDGGARSDAVAPGDGGARGRVTSGLVALYELEDGSGTTIHDTSGVGAPLDLTIVKPNLTSWVKGGLAFTTGSIAGSPGAATKITSAWKSSGEITLEVWVRIAPSQQPWGRFVNVVSENASETFNAGMAVSNNQTDFGLRTTSGTQWPTTYTFPNGLPAAMTHIVGTRAQNGAVTFYVDGASVLTGNLGGDLTAMDDTYRLALGNTPVLDRPFVGELHLVAVYARALTASEVKQNFAAQADP